MVLLDDIKQVVAFMKVSGVRAKFFISSVSLSLALTLFGLYTVALLFPLSNGIIKQDFSHVKNLKLIGGVVEKYPEYFNSSIPLFLLLVCWIYLTVIIKNALQYASFLSTQYQSKIATVKLRSMLFDRCLNFGKGFYDKNKLVAVHRIITMSTSTIEKQFKLFQNFIIQIFLLVMYTASMLHISWKLTLISVITFPFFSVLTKKAIHKIQSAIKESEISSTNLNERVMNLLYCMPVVRGFAKEETERSGFAVASDEDIRQSFKKQKLVNLLGPIEDIASTTNMLFLACGMAIIIHYDHALDPAGAFVFFYIAQKIMPAMNAINTFRLGIVNASKAVEDINWVLSGNHEYIVKSGSKKFKQLEDKIEIKNLSFTYSGRSDFVLKDVSITIPKGKMTAIVGPTGSGKSTITNLLLRFYECPNNSIFIDGVDICEFDIQSLRKRISFVGQDVLLFNNSISYNMSYACEESVSREKLYEIGLKTTLNDFVEKLPEGYDTVVAERGSNFSAGEKQRISIARALLRDRDILIMDEATSALDNKTEQKILATVKENSPGNTVIVISHRLSTIKEAQHIIYLDKGKVIESGTFEELLELKGEFHKQWLLHDVKNNYSQSVKSVS